MLNSLSIRIIVTPKTFSGFPGPCVNDWRGGRTRHQTLKIEIEEVLRKEE